MKDPVSEISRGRIKRLYPGLRPLVYRVLQDVMARSGRAINVAQGLRTFDEQLVIYSEGRQLQGDVWKVVAPSRILTNAKPGLSWHCYGLAFDISWAGTDPYLEHEHAADDLWRLAGDCGEAHGFSWGGRHVRLLNGVFDRPHFDMAFGLTIAQALELFQHGGLPAVWAFIDKVRGVPEGQDWDLVPKGAH